MIQYSIPTSKRSLLLFVCKTGTLANLWSYILCTGSRELLQTILRKEEDKNVYSHFVPRSFRTQVISYHFGHFVPFWSFRSQFYFHFGNFVLVWSFRTKFGHFVPTFIFLFKIILVISFRVVTFSYPSHFVPRVISYSVESFSTQVILYLGTK